jgi:hypothetical protein
MYLEEQESLEAVASDDVNVLVAARPAVVPE